MNTLPKAITAKFFPTEEAYLALKAHWSTLVNSDRKKELTPSHHLLYLALMGKDWRKGFTPITNKTKLANGAYEGWGLNAALYRVWYGDVRLLDVFDGLVSKEALALVKGLVPASASGVFRHYATYPENLDRYARANMLLEAYNVPEEWVTAMHADRALKVAMDAAV